MCFLLLCIVWYKNMTCMFIHTRDSSFFLVPSPLPPSLPSSLPTSPFPPSSPLTHTHTHTHTDWTLALTDYMNVCVTRLCNESSLLKGSGGSRHDSLSASRHQSASANQQGPSEEDEAELNKWQYITHLASYLYQVRGRDWAG